MIKLFSGQVASKNPLVLGNFLLVPKFFSNAYLWVRSQIQSNLNYSKCQGLPDFLRIIGSSNFRNRYFSEMFSELIFDCIYKH